MKSQNFVKKERNVSTGTKNSLNFKNFTLFHLAKRKFCVKIEEVEMTIGELAIPLLVIFMILFLGFYLK